jgi:hypothetical protein
MSELFAKAGFNCPPAVFTQDDPRGPEYGRYEVKEEGSSLAVVYCDYRSKERAFTLRFDSQQDFLNWASDMWGAPAVQEMQVKLVAYEEAERTIWARWRQEAEHLRGGLDDLRSLLGLPALPLGGWVDRLTGMETAIRKLLKKVDDLTNGGPLSEKEQKQLEAYVNASIRGETLKPEDLKKYTDLLQRYTDKVTSRS